ncbi:MAG TPA: sugar ABC transporter substrate-binding protein [Gaiellaceae bacterium]|jgi:simple sugar transport system substrate-binding protein/ribose transport system substrate-binding protein|nr:sugar ABC transporter substrate-binding protein [Gaiellaceae bacterium]
MRRRLSPKLFAGLALLTFGLVGVSAQAAVAGHSSSPLKGFKLASYIQNDVSSGKKLNFVYITNDLASSYTAAQKAGVVKAAKVLGVDATLQGPPTGAAQDQVNLIQTLVTQQKVDGIVVAAVNVDSLKPVIQAAFSAGIPLISAFTDQPGSKQLAFIGEDNHAFGVYEGKLLAKRLAGKSGKVVLLSVDTAAGWSTARISGLQQGLKANPHLTTVGPINTSIEPAQMFNAIQSAMQANSDAIAIASVDCCSIDGAAKWVQTNGKTGKIPVIGTDALQQTLNYIKGGQVIFSISQNPVGQVFDSIQELKAFVTKGTPPKTVILPPLLVTKSNAATVTPEG